MEVLAPPRCQVGLGPIEQRAILRELQARRRTYCAWYFLCYNTGMSVVQLLISILLPSAVKSRAYHAMAASAWAAFASFVKLVWTFHLLRYYMDVGQTSLTLEDFSKRVVEARSGWFSRTVSVSVVSIAIFMLNSALYCLTTTGIVRTLVVGLLTLHAVDIVAKIVEASVCKATDCRCMFPDQDVFAYLQATSATFERETSGASSEFAWEGDTNETCVFCFDGLSGADAVSRMACGHRFHSDCLSKWLWHNPSCPFRCSPAVASPNCPGALVIGAGESAAGERSLRFTIPEVHPPAPDVAAPQPPALSSAPSPGAALEV